MVISKHSSNCYNHVQKVAEQFSIQEWISFRHASEICRMALDLQAASGMVVRPDIRPKTISMKCGIHTGSIVAGI